MLIPKSSRKEYPAQRTDMPCAFDWQWSLGWFLFKKKSQNQVKIIGHLWELAVCSPGFLPEALWLFASHIGKKVALYRFQLLWVVTWSWPQGERSPLVALSGLPKDSKNSTIPLPPALFQEENDLAAFNIKTTSFMIWKTKTGIYLPSGHSEIPKPCSKACNCPELPWLS